MSMLQQGHRLWVYPDICTWPSVTVFGNPMEASLLHVCIIVLD